MGSAAADGNANVTGGNNVRWEYHAHNFLGFVQLACLVILFKRF